MNNPTMNNPTMNNPTMNNPTMNNPTKIVTLTSQLNQAAFAAAKYREDVIIARREDRSVYVLLRATKVTRRGGRNYPYRCAIGYARFGCDMIPVIEGLWFPLIPGGCSPAEHQAVIARLVNEALAAADAVAALRQQHHPTLVSNINT